MKNVLLVSADFPTTYYQFAKAYKNNGCTVLVIGSTPYDQLHPELKANVDEYCQTWEMENIDKMSEIVGYLQNKYGPIDYLESNIEYWLRSDSILRERFGIRSGLYPHELDEYQRKSSMKKAFIEAGANVAPYIIVRDLESLEQFAEKYGYPLFTKPDIGVGSAGNYKLENHEQLVDFYYHKPMIDYIVEPFIKGRIITFDGIADADSNVVVAANELFPPYIFELQKKGIDMFYYVNKSMPRNLLALGKRIIKALKLKNRFFHTELFVAENDVKDCFKAGDIVALEVNIRTPGGFTPDLLNFGLSTNLYQMLADIICFGTTNQTVGDRYFAACASRRRVNSYFYSDEDIYRTFKNEICFTGDYPEVFSDLMGNKFYMAKFNTEKDALLFRDYVNKLANGEHHYKNAVSHLTGEDKKILDERKRESKESKNICDTHIDGA